MASHFSIRLLLLGLVLGCSFRAFPASTAWPQNELIRQSDVIAIVDIHSREFSMITGSIFEHDGKEFPTSLILYSSSVTEILYGRIAKEPFIVQFDGAGDRNPLEEGRYILFLRAEGHLFSPLESGFKITNDKVYWYVKQPNDESSGPNFGEVPLDEVIRDIKNLIRNNKKS